MEREKNKEREERKKAGLDTADIDTKDEEDYLGVGPLIEKLEKEKEKKDTGDLNMYDEPTDSESEDDERFAPDAVKKRAELFEKKFTRHEELLKTSPMLDEEDYLGVGPLIEKLEKEKEKKDTGDLNMYEEPTDSESEDDERFAPDAVKKRAELFEKKFTRHEELLKNFTDAGN
ncbi:hypothetical protein Vadar_029595 [Vaccinium darrowii]|uniref:Uncharacterized protein n=1 Tax=Vaccinium darrowii TaxID=229202 RepID=A0ACB7XVK0_9ERIC|nr:hypothetical protein Vadar_029595 [Vaccinium darrowii]